MPDEYSRSELLSQEADLLAFAQKAGYEVLGIFKETASGAKRDRAERQNDDV